MTGVITVFAASGRQGSAAVHALMTAGYRVRAVVRDPAAPAAVALSAVGAELLPGSLDDTDSIARAMTSAHGCFLYQPGYISAQATPGISPDDELRRGRAVIDAAAEHGIGHIVYSSALSADRADTSPLLRPKTALEHHLHASAVPATVLRPVGFMENYLGPARGLQPNGTLTSTAPPEVTEQLIAVRDIGRFAATAFATPDQWVGRALDIAGDELTTPQIAETITTATGREVHYQHIPLDTIADPQRAAAIAAMYSPDRPTADLAQCRDTVRELTAFTQWLTDPTITSTLTTYLTEAPTR